MSAESGAGLGATVATDAVAIAFDGRVARALRRVVAAEVPVQIVYAGAPFGVMMATPADLEDFAYGFSLTEGVIARAPDIRGLDIARDAATVRMAIDLAPARLHAHLARRRAMTGRTGCGVCGIDDPAALPRAAAPAGGAPNVALGAIERALAGLDDLQVLNAATRAVHGAAWARHDGALAFVREDVGRHNALDKLIGALLRADIAPASGFVVVTSRASFEMVEKAATFGARTLVAISAPTALAIERARTLDVALIGIARRDGVTVFHGAERVLAEPGASPAVALPPTGGRMAGSRP